MLFSDKDIIKTDSIMIQGVDLQDMQIHIMQIILGKINIVSLSERNFKQLCSVILGHSGGANKITIKDIDLNKNRKLLNEDSIYIDQDFKFLFENLTINENLRFFSKMHYGVDLSSATISYFKKEKISNEVIKYIPDNKINFIKLFILLAIPNVLWFINDFKKEILRDEITNLLSNRIQQNGTILINIPDVDILQEFLLKLNTGSYKIITN